LREWRREEYSVHARGESRNSSTGRAPSFDVDVPGELVADAHPLAALNDRAVLADFGANAVKLLVDVHTVEDGRLLRVLGDEVLVEVVA